MNVNFHISPELGSLLVVLLPFAGFLYQLIAGKQARSGLIPSLAMLVSGLISVAFVFPAIWNKTPFSVELEWFTIGQYSLGFGLHLNNLSVLMQLVVCLIALPVHFYSKHYMKNDPGIHRYWTFLSLFCTAMLGLTIASNLFMMYVFWELIGFASYLLIGFWFDRPAAVQANKKAFIINRIGDLGFLLGIAAVFTTYGSLNLLDLFGPDGLVRGTSPLSEGWATFTGCCFLLAAMAKSAQFPLHVWLPDAMEGPTSVSSLIHAATMVAAGVFLLSSIFPIFNQTVLLLTAIIGCFTALIAALFALTQHDIKKILAFSTVSQLGYMIASIGMGAWDAAMFHLTTHAFFKCLLFLGAGAIIHQLAHFKSNSGLNFDPQNIQFMGGLRRFMPKTFLLMTVAALALAGFPLTSGFLSKDAILVHGFQWAEQAGWGALLIPLTLSVVSVLTAFYIGRMIIKVFMGRFHFQKEAVQTPIQEAASGMLLPMGFLALGSLAIGFSLHPFSYHGAYILKGLSSATIAAESSLIPIVLPIVLTLGAAAGWWLGWYWYARQRYPFAESNKWIAWSANQGYLNQAYERAITNSTLRLSTFTYWIDRNLVDGLVHLSVWFTRQLAFTSAWIDRYLVDGLVNTTAALAYQIGHLLRWVQNGRLQNYLGFAFTILLIGIVYLIFN